ncbi:MAG: hypothetical protein WCK65_03765, partial [Rhodospirillaceae bacterium]
MLRPPGLIKAAIKAVVTATIAGACWGSAYAGTPLTSSALPATGSAEAQRVPAVTGPAVTGPTVTGPAVTGPAVTAAAPPGFRVTAVEVAAERDKPQACFIFGDRLDKSQGGGYAAFVTVATPPDIKVAT